MEKKQPASKVTLSSLKQQVAQLEEERKLLDEIISLIPGHVYWKNTELEFLGCNNEQAFDADLKSRADIVGLKAIDLIKKNQPEAERILQAKAIRDVDQQVMSTDTTIAVEEIAVLDDGSTGYFLSKKAPLHDTEGKVKGLVGVTLDITKLKEAEKQLVLLKEKAEAASKAKSEFLRNIEHQLRTPFSGIYSLVELLAETESDPERQEMLAITSRSAKEFLDLLNEIIDFVRLGTDNTIILSKRMNLKQIIEQQITMEKAAAVIKNIKLIVEYPDDIPTIFLSDPNRIQKVVMNLLSNAIKFTPEGKVKISVRMAKMINDRQAIIQLIVSDTGIGIPQENQSIIYEKFSRLHPANQNTYGGAGLGLSIVKHIMEELEGDIDLESDPGKGTTFICTLPLKRPLLDHPTLEK